jgi:hypothetical protein
MRFIVGVALALFTISYWWYGANNVYHGWEKFDHHPKVDCFGRTRRTKKINFVVGVIIVSVFGCFLIKWSAQLLGLGG